MSNEVVAVAPVNEVVAVAPTLGSVLNRLGAIQEVSHIPVNLVPVYMSFEKGDTAKGMLDKIAVEDRETDGAVKECEVVYWWELASDGKKIIYKSCAMNHFVRTLKKNFASGEAFYAVCTGDVKNKTNAFKSRSFEIYKFQ
jgi:hypothetical protein